MLSRDELAKEAGYSVTSSSFHNALGKLRALELLEAGTTRLGKAPSEAR